ncbi:MAG TPA: 3-hydroxyacyl-CoA dehydrogenase NAD-binding domain-containing protein [Desulfomonilaceae bacterium]|nr:3-hydroxyacyl-CoA dehydrogenase NAD-binding domain-containing protein [Desulfomonilaceae bacterium]
MPEVTYSLDQAAGLATMTIDTAGPVNTIGQKFITDLERASAAAVRDHVRGVIIVSAKKKSFLDGANLKEILTDATPQIARLVVMRYQAALESLAKAPFPVVAILDGQSALGGGFELLLWSCDHVFATPASSMGLPEVNVGLFPAGGGTQTLRRVVGFKTAVEMITTGRVSPAEAYGGTGIITVCASEELVPKATQWLTEHQGITNRNYDPGFQEPNQISDEEKQRVLNTARFRHTISPFRPYLLAAVDALEAGVKMSFDQAVANEAELFVPLLFHPNSRNKIDLFFLVTGMGPKLAKVDRSKALNIKELAIVGAGLMGQGIAQVAADRGIRVTLLDVDDSRTKAALETLDRTLEDLVSRGRWTSTRKRAAMENLNCTTRYEDLGKIPLVIECVFEDLGLKREILAKIQATNPDAIFASNTSTIPMSHIASGACKPEQVVGMHYFSPVPLMPLLEVIQGPQSSPVAVATAVTCGRAMGKTVILVGDGPGFYTSRTFGTFVMNGFRLAELGIRPWDVDLLALQAGFPQGPLHVYGTAGGNVVYHATKFMEQNSPQRISVPRSLIKLHDAGYVGAGQPCFYLDPRKMIPDESVLEHMEQLEGFPVPSDEEAKDILLLGMVNEAFWCLSDGVLRDYYSMDLGAALGIGFPDCWHGPARYVSQKGVKAVYERLLELSDKFSLPGLAPAPEFRTIMACGLDSCLV